MERVVRRLLRTMIIRRTTARVAAQAPTREQLDAREFAGLERRRILCTLRDQLAQQFASIDRSKITKTVKAAAETLPGAALTAEALRLAVSNTAEYRRWNGGARWAAASAERAQHSSPPLARADQAAPRPAVQPPTPKPGQKATGKPKGKRVASVKSAYAVLGDRGSWRAQQRGKEKELDAAERKLHTLREPDKPGPKPTMPPPSEVENERELRACGNCVNCALADAACEVAPRPTEDAFCPPAGADRAKLRPQLKPFHRREHPTVVEAMKVLEILGYPESDVQAKMATNDRRSHAKAAHGAADAAQS